MSFSICSLEINESYLTHCKANNDSLFCIESVRSLRCIHPVQIYFRSSSKRRSDAECARRGCQPVPILSKSETFSLLRLIEALKAGRQDRMPQYIASLIDQPGADIHTAQAKLLNENVTVTRDPENVEAIFTKQAQEFDIGPTLTTSTGEAWRQLRALLRPQFSREQISDVDLDERHLQRLMKAITVSNDGWTEKLDPQPLFSKLTHDTAIKFPYGYATNS